MTQNAISRLENPYYGKATLTTLKRIAAIFDVALIVQFVPFSQLVNRVSGTPYVEHGLSPESMNVSSFEEEKEQGTLETIPCMTQTPVVAQDLALPIPNTSWISIDVLNELARSGSFPNTRQASFVEPEDLATFVFKENAGQYWYPLVADPLTDKTTEVIKKTPESEIPIWMIAAAQEERRTGTNG